MKMREIAGAACVLMLPVFVAPDAAAQGGGRGVVTTEHAQQEQLHKVLQDVANRLREVERAANLQRRGATPPAPTDPLGGDIVRDAPFSADATTTVTQTLGDGTRIVQTTTARFYRDRAGRVRREQQIAGLGAVDPSAQPRTVITVDADPSDGSAHQLDPDTRTARRVARGGGAQTVRWFTGTDNLSFNLGAARYFAQGTALTLQMPTTTAVPAGAGAPQVTTGSRQIEGLKTTGRTTRVTVPTGAIGNDRPFDIVEERWESPELQMTIYSRHDDPRTGEVEFKLTNISRAEPPPDLFQIPSDYQIIEAGGGGGGRGRAGGPAR